MSVDINEFLKDAYKEAQKNTTDTPITIIREALTGGPEGTSISQGTEVVREGKDSLTVSFLGEEVTFTVNGTEAPYVHAKGQNINTSLVLDEDDPSRFVDNIIGQLTENRAPTVAEERELLSPKG